MSSSKDIDQVQQLRLTSSPPPPASFSDEEKKPTHLVRAEDASASDGSSLDQTQRKQTWIGYLWDTAGECFVSSFPRLAGMTSKSRI